MSDNKDLNEYTNVGLVGRTNSGKSTLLNNLIGKKIAAVSKKVNTTRIPLNGICQFHDQKFLLFDAPGVCQIKTVLDRIIFQNILKIIHASDIIWWMISFEDEWKKDNQILAQVLAQIKKPIFLILNKIDLTNKDHLLAKIKFLNQKFSFTEIIPISAKKKKNFNKLLEFTSRYLKTSSQAFPKNQFSFNSLVDIAQEIIREQILLHTNEEVPHHTILINEDFSKNKGHIRFFFTLLVAHQSQKAIVIGQKGSKIKDIRVNSEHLLSQLWKCQVFVFLKVKVQKNWFQDPKILQKLNISWEHE